MKATKRITAAALAAAVFILCTLFVQAVDVSAKSAIVMDAATGRVLFEKNADTRSLIASTTKIMTGLLVCESGMELDAPVTVPPEAVGIEGSSVYLKTGETVTPRALLYGMLLHSGNDAAVALAVLCAGSVEAFTAQMNGRAAELGLHDTKFANPNGLDDENHYSTARELALLAAAAMKNETFAEVVGTKSCVQGGRQLTNHNKLLWKYPGAIGVKTGYTKAAGRILVSAAERDGRRLIAVTISDPDDWRDHAALLDAGFAAFAMQRVLTAGAEVGKIAVLGGEEESVPLLAAKDVAVPLLPGEKVRLRLKTAAAVYASVTKHAAAGTAEIVVGDTVLASVPVRYGHAVEEKTEEQKPGVFARIFGG